MEVLPNDEKGFSRPCSWNIPKRSEILLRDSTMAVTFAALASTALVMRAPSPRMQATEPPHIAVVGAGWGGWGAAKALVENGCKVTLLDALPDPTGKTPYLTPSGKPFEAGTRGFWMDYPNINSLVSDLGLNEDEIFTPFTNSSFYSPDGLEATAPVFSEGAHTARHSLLPSSPPRALRRRGSLRGRRPWLDSEI